MTIPWPDVPSSLFGPASGDESPVLNVNLRWFREVERRDVVAFKEGYRRGAQSMAESARRREASPDYLVWPITWLWRHYLELALKDIVARGPQLQDEGVAWTWPGKLGHRLLEAWRKAKPFIVEHGDPQAPVIAHVEAIITEFDRLDPAGFGFRYPLATDGVSPALETHEDWLNIDRIDSTMQKVANFLDSVAGVQAQALEDLQEMARYYRE